MNEIEGQIKDEPEQKSLKIQASLKLIETIKNNESFAKSQSRKSVLDQASHSGLRSQKLLKNYIRASREEKQENQEMVKLS